MASISEIPAGLSVQKPNHSLSMNLDLLRAVAVLCVFFSHILEWLDIKNGGHSLLGMARAASLGEFGVVIFFVHTSFVLMGSLQRLEQSAVNKVSLILGFWIRRFFRIYPLAIFFVIVAVAFRVPVFPGLPYVWLGWKAIVANLTLTQNLTRDLSLQGPMWTLPLEVQMYLILPLAYLAAHRAWRYRSMLLWMASLVLALTLPRINVRLNLFAYAPCFAAGILAFGLTASRKGTSRLPAWMWPAGIFLLLLLFRPFELPREHKVLFGAVPKHKMLLDSAFSLALGVLYANVKEHRWGATQRFFHWTAEHSYGIYLSHIAVFWVAMDVMSHFSTWARVAVLVAGSIGVPAVLYATLERPLIQVGGRIAARLLRPRVASAV